MTSVPLRPLPQHLTFNLEDYSPGEAFFADTETNGLYDTVTKMHSLVLIDMVNGAVISCADQPGYVPIRTGLDMLAKAKLIVGQNWIRYDDPVIRKLYPEWDTQAVVRDTLVLSRLIWGDLREIDATNRKKALARGAVYALPGPLTGQHGLEAWGYRLGLRKGDYGKQENAWETWNEAMQTYCVGDVRVTEKFWNLIISRKPSLAAVEMEHEFAEILAYQERRGFRFDEAKAQELYATLVRRRSELKRELEGAIRPWYVSEGEVTPKKSRRVKRPDLGTRMVPVKKRGKVAWEAQPVTEEYTEGVPYTKVSLREFNPSSRQQVADRLITLYGWEPDEFTPDGHPKVDETVLEKLPYDLAPLLTEFFTVEKRIGQLAEGEQAWLRLVRNGRIYGSVNTIGAVTRRCTHSNPNVAQVPSVTAPYGAECRALFIPTEGWFQVGADASGLELRCLAHFLHRYDGGVYGKILLEGDVHWANACAMGLVSGDRDPENKRHKIIREGVKRWFYGFLYGSGDLKAGKILQDILTDLKKFGLPYEDLKEKFFGDVEVPGEELLKKVGGKLKRNFLSKTPALKKLIEAVQSKAKAQGYIMALDGQALKIRSAHAALNTLLQSAGALVVKKATVIVHRILAQEGLVRGEDFAMVAHIHDEMQFEARTEEIADRVGKAAVQALSEAGDHFRFRVRIDGEFKVGRSWLDTH
ncbi:DNA polymerase [Inquilinus limosus]|uniref:DNA polymerase n=1 Tax=Inquilinus limosus TaxID=171674 RepID=UPI00040EC577|nr:DNA polymerase [Inquilinus limosus]